MDFETFQATRRECDDIGKAISAEFCDDEPGRPLIVRGYLYEGSLYIERLDDGRYVLTIYNYETVGTELEPLERTLFEYATDEGYFDVPSRAAQL